MYTPPRTPAEKQTRDPYEWRKIAILGPAIHANIPRFLVAFRLLSLVRLNQVRLRLVRLTQIAVGRLSMQPWPRRIAPGPRSAIQVLSQTFCPSDRKLRPTTMVVVPLCKVLDRIGSVRKCCSIFGIPHEAKSQFRQALRKIAQCCLVRFNHSQPPCPLDPAIRSLHKTPSA